MTEEKSPLELKLLTQDLKTNKVAAIGKTQITRSGKQTTTILS